jgi:uncharacterized protein (TIGR00369 family)
MMTPVMNEAELQEFLIAAYPQIFDMYPGFSITHIAPGEVNVTMETDHRHIRAGGTISGPTIFSLADMGGYACVLSHIGGEALAVTTNLNLNFMRKADPGPIFAKCRILKLGKRLMVFDAEITGTGSDEMVAHATGTYAIPPRTGG